MIETLETRTMFSSHLAVFRLSVATAPTTTIQPVVVLGPALFQPVEPSNLPAKIDGPDLNGAGNDVAIEPIEIGSAGSDGGDAGDAGDGN